MTEYWLQKKTIGGWSNVTWYSDQKQAEENYKRAWAGGKSGYSWRLFSIDETNLIMEDLLDEVTEVQASELDTEVTIKTGWGS